MKAYVLTRYGGPEMAALREVARPQPGPGEVLVRVHAAGLNPIDFKTREGAIKVIQPYSLPVVMGNEMAGVVEACGKGADRFAPVSGSLRVWPRTGWAVSPNMPCCPRIFWRGCQRGRIW